MKQPDLFPLERPDPEQIIEDAMRHEPVATYALISGGDGSLAATHWYMNNVPNCRPAHIITGIGIPETTDFVRDTCKREGWDLVEIRAKEDCGQDYDAIVMKHGFPGPAQHTRMYAQLKERAIRLLVSRSKNRRSDKVMLLTGICHDDSSRRSGYGNSLITFNGAQMWVNALYWRGASWVEHYLNANAIPRNPVAYALGMSGECGCGAYASEGELRIWERVCPAFGARIRALTALARAAGHEWNWDQGPPQRRDDQVTEDMFMPMCRGCLKAAA